MFNYQISFDSPWYLLLLALVPLLLGLYVWVVGFARGAWAPPLCVLQEEVL